MPDSTLTTILDKRLGKTSNLDPKWVEFIRDHHHYLRSRANILRLDSDEKERFRYKFDFLLRTKQVNPKLHWIVKVINDLDQYESFINRDYLYVPTMSDISSLYRQYKTATTVRETDLRT